MPDMTWLWFGLASLSGMGLALLGFLFDLREIGAVGFTLGMVAFAAMAASMVLPFS
jgi:hypothetical protein